MKSRDQTAGTPARQLISMAQVHIWNDALRACGDHDVYHLAKYQSLAAGTDCGEPQLFWYRHGEHAAALPLLLRNVPSRNATGAAALVDATSAYGYPGPITNIGREHPAAAAFKAGFQRELQQGLRGLRAVSCFIRHHPLLEHSWLLDGCGRTRSVGPTLAMDLQNPADSVGAGKRYRQNLKQAQRSGAKVYEDLTMSRISEFASLYRETMRRLQALDYYHFSDEYFRRLASVLRDHALLFHALVDDRIIASVIVFRCNRILQYHLSASDEAYARFSPTRLILDHIWRWGRDHGCRWFHLGGGLGSRRDSLFRFKAGFSQIEFDFKVTSMILDRPAYDRLCHESGSDAVAGTDADFFPEYRSVPAG